MSGSGSGQVALPRGFTAAGVSCGLKRRGPDLGIVASETAATAVGIVTRNRYQAAPVALTKQLLRRGSARAVVVNSGNANACTGAGGMEDAKRMGALTAEALGLERERVLVCSTGVIGRRLAMDRIEEGIPAAAASLATEGGAAFADAILTTDTRRKVSVAEADGARLVGIAKGAGMIAPELATMLVFLLSDAAVERSVLAGAVRGAASETFEAISIDGCMSTNDTVLALANGARGGPPIGPDDPRAAGFAEAVREVFASLAHQMVDDGEGANKVVTIRVDGASKPAEARTAARAVADSILLRCAIAGEDPYWGRVLAALGAVPFSFDPRMVDVWMCGEHLSTGGGPGPGDPGRAREGMRTREIEIRIDLHRGAASASVLTNDLSVEFVRFNTEYTT